MISQLGQLQVFMDRHPVLSLLIILWSLTWKAVALWKAARIGHKSWFAVLLIVNLVGIPEMIYLFFVARKFKVESEVRS